MKKNDKPELAAMLLNILPKGRENALSASFLTTILQLDDARDLRHLVRKLRLDGELVCSGSDGYWITDKNNACELREFVAQWEANACGIREMLKTAKKRLRELESEEVAHDFRSCKKNLKQLSDGIREG